MVKRFSAARVRDAAPLFAALGDPTRLGLVARLSAGGPVSIARLSEHADVSRQAITKHLHVLSEAGLVRGFRRGRQHIWELEPNRLADLFGEDMLGDDLEEWLAESNLTKRSFRNVAVIAGLIERRFPGQEKSGRQVTFSSDLIYDVLSRHEPDHVLIKATRADVAAGLLDLRRLALMLKRIQGHIVHRRLDRVSPLAVPLMLEIGREPVFGEAMESLLGEAAESLIEEATRLI